MNTRALLVGNCLCGNVRYAAAGPASRMWYCHCEDCRKASSVAFASWVAVDYAEFQWQAGEESVKTVPGAGELQRCFCGNCGSVLPGFNAKTSQYWLPAGGLQGELSARPEYHAWLASKPPWFEIADALPCYARARAEGHEVAPQAEPAPAECEPAVRGSCLCGAVAYRLTQPVEAMRSCHCSRCRCATGSACFVGLPGLAANLEFERGQQLLADYHLPESRYYQRRFCSCCGSAMPGKLPGVDRTVASAGTLDSDPGVRLRYHIFTGSGAAWYELVDGLPQFESYPPKDFRPNDL